MKYHNVSDESLAEFKRISDEEGITYESDLEMKDSAQRLVSLFDLLIEMDMEERARKKRLEVEPDGYALEGKGRSCSLCGCCVYEGDGWYDKWGFKCHACQNAVNKHIVPGSMCRDYDNEKCITVSSLSWKTDLKYQTIMKLVRQGKIKVRQIPHGAAIILRKENPNISDILNEEIELQAKKKASR